MKTKLILGLSVLALAFAPAAKKMDLNFKLEKGKTYHQTIDMNSTTKQTIQGQEQTVKQAVSSKMSMELKSEDPAGDTYTLTYENINMQVEQGPNVQTYNSDTAALETVDPMSRIFTGITGEKFDATFTKKGKVKKVSGLEGIISDATSGMGPQGQAIASQLSSSFGDDGLAKNLETLTAIMPEKAVKVGDTWTNEQFTSSGLPLILKNTFTLKGVKDKVATIAVDGTLSIDPANASTQIQGMDATYFMDGTRSGTIRMEVETGWVKSATFKDDIAGSITLAANAQMPEGLTIPIEMKTTTTVGGE